MLSNLIIVGLALSGIVFGLASESIAVQALLPMIALCAVAQLGMYALRFKSLPQGVTALCLGALILGIIYAACVIFAERGRISLIDVEFLKTLGRLSLVPCTFLFAYMTNWRPRWFQATVCVLFAIALLVLASLHSLNGFETGYVVMDLHSNILGIMSVIAIYYGVLFSLDRGWSWDTILPIVAGLIALPASVSRGSMACLIFVVCIYAVQWFWRPGYRMRVAAFPLILTACLLITFQFSAATQTTLFDDMSRLLEYTINKPLDTGRGKMWVNAYADFIEHPWFGRGTAAHDAWTHYLPSGEVIKLSVHNYYWAILHEVGVVGFSALMLYFWMIWSYVARADNPTGRLALSFFGAILIQQVGETQLSTGTFTMGASDWTAIAAGACLSFAKHSSDDDGQLTDD